MLSPPLLVGEGLASRISKIWDGLGGLELGFLPMSWLGFFLLGGFILLSIDFELKNYLGGDLNFSNLRPLLVLQALCFLFTVFESESMRLILTLGLRFFSIFLWLGSRPRSIET